MKNLELDLAEIEALKSLYGEPHEGNTTIGMKGLIKLGLAEKRAHFVVLTPYGERFAYGYLRSLKS